MLFILLSYLNWILNQWQKVKICSSLYSFITLKITIYKCCINLLEMFILYDLFKKIYGGKSRPWNKNTWNKIWIFFVNFVTFNISFSKTCFIKNTQCYIHDLNFWEYKNCITCFSKNAEVSIWWKIWPINYSKHFFIIIYKLT